MLRPQHPLAGLQRPLIQRLSPRVVAFARQQSGQVVHAPQRVGMLRPQHPLAGLQRPAQERFGGWIETVIREELTQLCRHEVLCGGFGGLGPTLIGLRVAHAHVAPHPPQRMPVAGEFPLCLAVVECQEERDVGQAGLQPLPRLGGMKLERPLRGSARGHVRLVRVALEVVGEGEVGGSLRLCAGHPCLADRLAEEVVPVGREAGALAEVGFEGEEERGPQGTRKGSCGFGFRVPGYSGRSSRLRCPAEQVEPFGFGEALAGGPQVREGAAREVAGAALGVLIVEVLLPSADDAQEEFLGIVGLQVVRYTGGQLLEAAELAELLQHRAQEERVPRAGRGDQLPAQGRLDRPALRVHMAAEQPEVLRDHGVRLGFRRARQIVFRPAPLAQGVERRTGQCRGEHGDMGRELAGHEAQAVVGFAALHLVEAVEKQDHPSLADGLREPDGQRVAELLGIGGNVVGELEALFQLPEQTPQEALGRGAVGRGAEVVLEEEVVGMVGGPVARPGRQQRGLAAAALAGDHQALAPSIGALGKFIQRGEVGGTLDAAEQLVPRVGLVGHALLGEWVRRLIFGIEAVDQLVELPADDLREGLGAGIGLDQRQVAVADALLERGELGLALLGAAGCLRLAVLPHLGGDGAFDHVPALVVGQRGIADVGRVAEVEEGQGLHLGVVQHAVEDLQFGHRGPPLDVLLEPRLPFNDLGPDGVGNPAVALAEQAEEIRTAAFDLGQAQRQDLPFRRLFLGDAPAQVHLGEGDEALGALAAQFGEDILHEQVPFPHHVAEGGRDEDADHAVGPARNRAVRRTWGLFLSHTASRVVMSRSLVCQPDLSPLASQPCPISACQLQPGLRRALSNQTLKPAATSRRCNSSANAMSCEA